MYLKLMYITNNPKIAEIADKAGIDRVFIDMEHIGKEQRQNGMDTVKSHHTISDIKACKAVLKKSKLLARVNPIHEKTDKLHGSEAEIAEAISAGADVIMLPMFKTTDEVTRFVKIVNGGAKTLLLLETKEAAEQIDAIVKIPGIDEIHIGLNDLHLSLGKKFMFELLTDGTVDRLCSSIKKAGIKFGFGGIARLGHGMLPAENIIADHYRIGSGAAILSRSFCDAKNIADLKIIEKLFVDEVAKIRKYEEKVCGFSENDFIKNHEEITKKVNNIISNI